MTLGYLLLAAGLLAPVTATAGPLTYWNVFNIEGESTLKANFVTYATLADMVLDTNRLDVFLPSNNFGRNIVGSGASIMVTTGPDPKPVPEPGTLGLMLGGLGLLAGVRQRSRRA